MQAVLERFDTLDFFADIGPDARMAMADAGCWFSLAGGAMLYEQGTPSDQIYFVLSGRLIVSRTNDETSNIIGYIGAGEPVGEMSLLLDEPHTATVFALRDTELLAIPHSEFDRLLEQYGDVAAVLSRTMLRRARKPSVTFRKSSPRVFVLIGSSRSIDIDRQAERLGEAARNLGVKVLVMTDREEAPDSVAFDREEERHDLVILSARIADNAWYRFVLRHADRFLVFARRDALPPKPFPLSLGDNTPAGHFRLVDLVMLEEGVQACPLLDWKEAVGAQRAFRWNSKDDFARLARVIAGQSVGVVMSGGGARAYAHIGAMRALRERNIPIDFFGGTSMGGIVAACVAMGWTDAEVDYRVQNAFVDSNPLSDFRLPVVSLTEGCVVERRLKEHFGDALIEETQVPYFCVSADLASGRAHVHWHGLLWEALRASISLPGILPPVVEGDQLLVDGALINNFPVDVMAGSHRGMNIGIDVARRSTIDPELYRDPPGFFGWVRNHGIRTTPPIVGLLMRSATTRRESTMIYHPADITITPDVNGVDLRDWKEYDRAVDEGYSATIEAIDAHPALATFQSGVTLL